MAILNYLDLGASAAAVLLFLFAARSFVVGSNHEPLGWGFGIAAGGILAWLLREELGSFSNGMRLGLGIILLLPALRAIVDPKSTSVVIAVFSLLIAFAVAEAPVKRLMQAYGPETATGDLARTRLEFAKLEEQRDRAKNLLDELVLQKESLKRELKALGISNKEMAKHPRMQLLANTIEAQEKWEQALVVIEKGMHEKRLRIESLEAGIEMERMGEENPELADILRDMETQPDKAEDMTFIERAIQEDRMLEILEKEMQ